MKKTNHQDIPQSFIKGSSGAMSNDLRLNGKSKILYVDSKCLILGVENFPYRMFITPEFKGEKLPIDLKKDIYNIKELIIKPTFSIDSSNEMNNCSITNWLNNFKKLEYLRFEHNELRQFGLS